jgi:hypothetical protein
VADAIAAGQARQFPATEGVAVVYREMPEAVYRRSHKACIACFAYFGPGSEEDDIEEEAGRFSLAELGLYEYSHLFENWISGPYGCERRPLVPLHVDQLPPRLRDQVRLVHFDNLRFGEVTHLQPVEHTECRSWEAAWLDAAGKKRRPMPGREAEFNEEPDEAS